MLVDGVRGDIGAVRNCGLTLPSGALIPMPLQARLAIMIADLFRRRKKRFSTAPQRISGKAHAADEYLPGCGPRTPAPGGRYFAGCAPVGGSRKNIAVPTPRIRADIRAAVRHALHRDGIPFMRRGAAGLGALPLFASGFAVAAIFRHLFVASVRSSVNVTTTPLTGRVYVKRAAQAAAGMRRGSGACLAGRGGTGSVRAGDVHA